MSPAGFLESRMAMVEVVDPLGAALPAQYRMRLTVGEHSARYIRRIVRSHLYAWQASGVRVEVTDGSLQLPVSPVELSLEAQGGRGLVLLDAVVDKWGVRLLAGGGRTVWFECRGDDSR